MRISWRDRRIPGAIGGVGLLASVVACFIDPADMARAWLTMALLFLGAPLGALMVLMLDDLTGGRWGEAIRPLLLAIAGTLPLALLAFVPLLFYLGAVFPWVADAALLSPTGQRKLAYLSVSGLVLRFVACSTLWLSLAAVLGVWGERIRRRPIFSGLGLGLHALLFTVFATDWMLSLEPDFYSTIYPMLVAAEQLVLVLAGVLLVPGLAERPGGTARSTLGEDLGKLLLSAVLVWIYLAFMQWVIIWSGDLPVEIGWFLKRMNNGWQGVVWAVMLLTFAVPFVGLISTRGKRDPALLRGIAGATLAGQVLEGIWRVAPAFPPSPGLLLMLPAALAMGGLNLALAGALLRRVPVVAGRRAHGEAG